MRKNGQSTQKQTKKQNKPNEFQRSGVFRKSMHDETTFPIL